MFDTFQGLPVHALVLHATVLAVPVAALLTVLVAFAPRWRPRGAWPVVVVDAVVTALVLVTKQSGEELERRLGSSPLVERHAEMGVLMLWFMLAVLAASVLVALARSRSGPLVQVLGVVALVVSVAAVVWVVRTGHSGSTAVWRDVISSTDG